ncbi:MAG: hypothetical protein VKN33_10355 [Candidatus Sericytochromatia bacterium]|nr:hypothetical protein [Candidatus Sericytochromatia bacterium]
MQVFFSQHSSRLLSATFTFIALACVALAAGADPLSAKESDIFQLPSAREWEIHALPPLGRAPRDLKRWEMLPRGSARKHRIDIEIDRTEPLERFPVRAARGEAHRLAQKLGYQNYSQRELLLKGAPGFYESWTAQPPSQAKFQVFAAHAFYRGAHIRIAAIAKSEESANAAERDLHQLLSRWAWKN